MNAVTIVLFVGLIAHTLALEVGVVNPGDILCRFYSDGTKNCFKSCEGLSDDSVTKLIKARSKPNMVTESQVQDKLIDPILFVKCTDPGESSKYTDSQGFRAIKKPPADVERKLYLGGCLFHNDENKKWFCRGCERKGGEVACNIGGFDESKMFFDQKVKKIVTTGWSMTGKNYGTLAVSHPS